MISCLKTCKLIRSKKFIIHELIKIVFHVINSLLAVLFDLWGRKEACQSYYVIFAILRHIVCKFGNPNLYSLLDIGVHTDEIGLNLDLFVLGISPSDSYMQFIPLIRTGSQR